MGLQLPGGIGQERGESVGKHGNMDLKKIEIYDRDFLFWNNLVFSSF
ncbi:MAG: hypothetical protein GY928_04205 [Colwellia sp.]|nr:hypothetical protein [Colwellia sp.]